MTPAYFSASLHRGSLDQSTAIMQLITSYSIMHTWGTHFVLLSRKAATKVLRPRSDRGLRCTDVIGP